MNDQNRINIDFNKPGPNKRVCAFLIDSIIALVCGVIISLMVSINITWIVCVIILFKDCFNGQSIGKYLVGIKIIDENNAQLNPLKTIVRNIFMVLWIFPIIEFIILLIDQKEGKRIGDKVAKTKVNDLKPQIPDNTFLWITITLLITIVLILMGMNFLSKILEISHEMHQTFLDTFLQVIRLEAPRRVH